MAYLGSRWLWFIFCRCCAAALLVVKASCAFETQDTPTSHKDPRRLDCKKRLRRKTSGWLSWVKTGLMSRSLLHSFPNMVKMSELRTVSCHFWKRFSGNDLWTSATWGLEAFKKIDQLDSRFFLYFLVVETHFWYIFLTFYQQLQCKIASQFCSFESLRSESATRSVFLVNSFGNCFPAN